MRRPTGASFRPSELKHEASLLLPAGTYGPAFLTPKNYFAIKDYNFSDLYVLFVGHLGDRIAGARPFEQPVEQEHAASHRRRSSAMQRKLTARGLYSDKIDGKAGMLTRAALGAYQKANGLKLDCWPTADVLDAHAATNENPAALSRPPGYIRHQVGRSAHRAEEARTAPADHVAVGVTHRTARPVAAGAAVAGAAPYAYGS